MSSFGKCDILVTSNRNNCEITMMRLGGEYQRYSFKNGVFRENEKIVQIIALGSLRDGLLAILTENRILFFKQHSKENENKEKNKEEEALRPIEEGKRFDFSSGDQRLFSSSSGLYLGGTSLLVAYKTPDSVHENNLMLINILNHTFEPLKTRMKGDIIRMEPINNHAFVFVGFKDGRICLLDIHNDRRVFSGRIKGTGIISLFDFFVFQERKILVVYSLKSRQQGSIKFAPQVGRQRRSGTNSARRNRNRGVQRYYTGKTDMDTFFSVLELTRDKRSKIVQNFDNKFRYEEAEHFGRIKMAKLYEENRCLTISAISDIRIETKKIRFGDDEKISAIETCSRSQLETINMDPNSPMSNLILPHRNFFLTKVGKQLKMFQFTNENNENNEIKKQPDFAIHNFEFEAIQDINCCAMIRSTKATALDEERLRILDEISTTCEEEVKNSNSNENRPPPREPEESSEFYPNDLTSIFHVFKFHGNVDPYFCLPKFMYFGKEKEEYIRNANSFDLSEKIITFSHEVNDEDHDTNISSRYILDFFSRGFRIEDMNDPIKMVKLYKFLHYTRLEELEMYFLNSLHQFSTQNLLFMFEKCLMEFETDQDNNNSNNNKRPLLKSLLALNTHKSNENLNEDGQKSPSEIIRENVLKKFKSGLTLAIFTELRRRKGQIQGSLPYVDFLEKTGYIGLLISPSTTFVELEDHDDYKNPNRRRVLMATKFGFDHMFYRMMEVIVERFPTFGPSLELFTVSQDLGCSKESIKCSKLLLILFSNFFATMFKYSSSFSENVSKNVKIEVVTILDNLKEFLEYVYPLNPYSRKYSELQKKNLQCYLELVEFGLMYQHLEFDILCEVQVLLVKIMKKKFQKSDEIQLFILESGGGKSLGGMPEEFLDRLLKDSGWASIVNEKLIKKLIEMARKVYEMAMRERSQQVTIDLDEKRMTDEDTSSRKRKRGDPQEDEEDEENEKKKRKQM